MPNAADTNYRRLADRVTSIGGVAEMKDGRLRVDLDRGEFKIHNFDLKTFTAILDDIELIGRPCHLMLDAHELDVAECDVIASCSQLVALDLLFVRFAPDALPRLAGLKNLNWITLNHANVPAQDLEFLGNLKFLKHLDLTCTGATNGTAKVLVQLPGLEHLYLNETQVTDEGVKELAEVTTLNEIGIGRLAGVTDEGLLALSRFKHLRSLDVAGTKITAKGIEEFLKKTSVDVIIVGPALLSDVKMQEVMKKYPNTQFW